MLPGEGSKVCNCRELGRAAPMQLMRLHNLHANALSAYSSPRRLGDWGALWIPI